MCMVVNDKKSAPDTEAREVRFRALVATLKSHAGIANAVAGLHPSALIEKWDEVEPLLDESTQNIVELVELLKPSQEELHRAVIEAECALKEERCESSKGRRAQAKKEKVCRKAGRHVWVKNELLPDDLNEERMWNCKVCGLVVETPEGENPECHLNGHHWQGTRWEGTYEAIWCERCSLFIKDQALIRNILS